MARLPVTIKEVAARAGVSMMTVSRVLRNKPHVGAETRQKVLAAAQAVGYRQNPLVGAWMAHLRTSKVHRANQQVLAFVTAESTRDGWRKSPEGLTIRHYFEGASVRANELGFKLEHFWLGDTGMSGRGMSRILRARGIAGLLVAPVPVTLGPVDFQWENFAPVAFGYSMRGPNLHRVTNHQLHSLRLAVEELHHLGYRRIGLALERRKNDRVDQNWTAGFLPYHASIPPGSRVPPYLPERLERGDFLAWVDECRPEVILGGDLAIIEWLKGAGRQVPRDIGFASLEIYPELGGPAGVDQNSLTIGATAVELLVEQLYHNQRGIPEKPKTVLIEGCWQKGKTVRKIREPSEAVPRSADAVCWRPAQGVNPPD